MRRTSIRRSFSIALVLAAAGLLRAAAAETRSRPAPRFVRADALRPQAAQPSVPGPPDGLAPARPAASRRAAIAREGVAEVERRGLEAGASAAEQLTRTEGWRESFRVGVYFGQRSALDDRELGRWDYEQGMREGRLDPEAVEGGSREGSRAALEAAASAAADQVERQFLDLAWKPVPSPRPESAPFEPDFAPTPEPDLESVFAAYPIDRVASVPRRLSESFAGSPWTPARLQACPSWRDAYEGGWRDPDRAFRSWASDAQRSSFWRKLAGSKRALFEASFADGFLDRLPAAYERFLSDAYRDGFESGWAYGAFVRAQWSFRQGYVHGFDAALTLAAATAFEREYPAAYTRAYGARFREWMGSPHPAILMARLYDASDDGIFQPGEDVLVEFALVNYGGAAGSYELSLEGGPLAASASTEVHLAARARRDAARPLLATLERGIPTPRPETLVLKLGEERRELPLRISYPIEFTNAVSYESRPLEARAGVRFELTNRSRKAVEQVSVVLEGADREPRLLGRIEPGATVEAAFGLEHVQALDLLGGTLAVHAAVEAGGEIHDRKEARFPDKTSRLDDPDLVAYMLQLGRDRDPEPTDVAGARRLLLRRLEVDWSARVDEDGNAYERDARDRGSRTALGELVKAYESERPALRSSPAWKGLDQEVLELSERLPGVHPNLRRWMKKLAARLG